MVAFNFKEEFVDKIISGEKCSTIRSTMRCKIGDNMQLYTGQRTKKCKLIKEATCVGLADIRIGGGAIWDIIGRIGLIYPNRKPLHEQEGFKNVEDFENFFKNQYDTDLYRGYLHAWQ